MLLPFLDRGFSRRSRPFERCRGLKIAARPRIIPRRTRPTICMTKKGIVLSVIALLLAAAYICFFTNWFNRETIQIMAHLRPNRSATIPRDSKSPPVYPVSFMLRRKYKLTSVKVVAAEEFATNQYAYALWHLISSSNSGSPPIRSFEYGGRIPGMKPASPGGHADPLEPDVTYVLIVEAGKISGRTNFFTKEFVQRATR